VGASLVGVGLGALLGSFLVALLPEGLPAEIAGISGFALGLWLGQTLGELLATDRAAARQSWSVTFLTYAVLVPPGYFLAQIGAAADSVLFGASLALAVGLLVLIRVTTNSQARTRELEAEVTESVSAREHLELIFDQAPEAIVGVDLAGSVSWMNRTAAAWLGWDEPTVGQPIELALPIQAADGGQLDHTLLLARAAADRHPVHAEGRLEGDPDAPHQVLVSYSAMEDGDGGSQGLVLLRDLADMPETVREQEELAVKLSHELRTPLTSILGYAELITTQTHKNPSTAPRTEYVQRISDSGTYMLRLVNNLLDLGRLAREDERLPISRVELVELTRAVVEAHRPQAAARNQQLDLQAPRPPLNTRTNDLALRQILTNLVANAVKYTPPDGSIKVVLSAEPGWIVWQVVDSGIGLSEEEQQKLFTRFFRSERPEARQTRGTGLGLALSKELLERLEGSIEVQSTVDQGSTFTVRVPRR
jgi:signal transduction histidine kinase